MKPRNIILIACLGGLLFIPFLGMVHLFDWDEINFAESAREMLVTHKYSYLQIDFQPFYEKPPFFIWVQALSMSVFGVNEFAARLPNAIIGIITLVFVFSIGRKLINEKFGWIWVLCYIGSFLPHFYFKTGLIDPLFNLFTFAGIYQFVLLTNIENLKPARPCPARMNLSGWHADGRAKNFRIVMLAGIFIGLAILTKGPVALLVTVFCLFFYWITFRFKPVIPFRYLFVFLVSAFIVSCAWFGLNTIKNGPNFLFAFIERQVELFKNPDAGHGGPFYFHFIVLFFGCFPASIFMFSALRNDASETYPVQNMKKWMAILLFTILLIFSIVKTKIIHYSSLAYFPITFLGAYGIFKLIWINKTRPKILLITALILISLLVSATIAGIPYIARHVNLIEPYINDDFGKAALKANILWSGWESLVGIGYFIVFSTGVFLFVSKRFRTYGAVTMLIAGALFIQLTLYIFTPKIEGYSQKAAIDFLIQHQNEDCYIVVWGYKSYAQLFYTEKPPSAGPVDNNIVFAKHVPKTVYIITKAGNDDAINEFTRHQRFKEVGDENGFVFLKREKD